MEKSFVWDCGGGDYRESSQHYDISSQNSCATGTFYLLHQIGPLSFILPRSLGNINCTTDTLEIFSSHLVFPYIFNSMKPKDPSRFTKVTSLPCAVDKPQEMKRNAQNGAEARNV
ncbi:hypothetical protein C5167_030833 [Papaver somniferum]|nr:hypothetical protein C5167_030833 [Papaver somniferum]